MNKEEFSKLLFSRYACRNFNGKTVDIALMEEICELSKYSPSACNSQPWKMYIISKEKQNDAINMLTKTGRNLFLKNAGGFIFLAEHNKPTLKPDVEKTLSVNHFTKYDIGELIAYITLTAKTMGIDSCIIGWVNKNEAKEFLKLEDDYECNIVIALGYSTDDSRPKTRKESKDIIKIL